MSIARKAIFSTLWVSGLNYLSIAVGTVFSILRDQVLLPYENGVYMFGVAVIDTLFILAAFSFNICVIQADEDKEDLYSTAFTLTGILVVAMLLVSAAAGWFLSLRGAESIKIQTFLVLAVFNSLNLFSVLFSAYLEKQLEYKKIARVNFFYIIAFPVVSYIMVLKGYGAWGMVAGQCTAFTISFFGMFAISRYPVGLKMNTRTAKWFLSYGWKLIFSRGMEVAFTRAGTLITEAISGTTLQGSFSRAIKYWEMAPQTVSPAVVTVALPTYSKLKHDTAKLSQAFSMVLFFMVRVLLPFVLVFAVLPESFLLILGKQWLDAVPVLRWLAIGALLSPVFENMKQLLYAIGKPEVLVRIRFVQLIVFIPAMIGLVLWMGISGAAVAMIINFSVGVVGAMIAVRRIVSVSWKLSFALPFLWAGVAAAIVFALPLPPAGLGAFAQFVLEALYLIGIFIILEAATEWKQLKEYYLFIRSVMKTPEQPTETAEVL